MVTTVNFPHDDFSFGLLSSSSCFILGMVGIIELCLGSLISFYGMSAILYPYEFQFFSFLLSFLIFSSVSILFFIFYQKWMEDVERKMNISYVFFSHFCILLFHFKCLQNVDLLIMTFQKDLFYCFLLVNSSFYLQALNWNYLVFWWFQQIFKRVNEA